jgi:hypothetical protein
MPPSHLARVILLEFPPPLNSGLESSAPVFCPVIKPVSQSPHPRPLWLALTTGLVAAFFSVLYQAIEEFLHLAPNQQFKELIVITVTSVGMLLAIEPILERIGPVREHHAFGHEDDILIRAGALLTIVATAFLHGLLHAHLSESLSAHGMVVLEQLLTALVAPTLITLSWIHGMRRERARWYGLSVGVLTGLGLVMFAMVQLYFLRPSAGLRDVPLRNAIRALLAVATSFLGFIVPTCAVNGFLGGLAIDRQWSAKAWSGIALGLLIAAAVEAVSFVLASSYEAHAIQTAALVQPNSMLSLAAEVVIANIGWAMGIWVRPDADGLLRGTEPSATAREMKWELATGAISAASMLALGLLISLGTIALGNQVTAVLLGQSP